MTPGHEEERNTLRGVKWKRKRQSQQEEVEVATATDESKKVSLTPTMCTNFIVVAVHDIIQ